MPNSEQYRGGNEFERSLSTEEIMTFADLIVWPTIDHMHGNDFRARAQVRKNVVVPRKTAETEHERITVYAGAALPGSTATNPLTGEIFRPCEAVIVLETRRPELTTGIEEVVLLEEEGNDYEAPWWEDPLVTWAPWESRVFGFSTNPDAPFGNFYSVEAQDEEELRMEDRQLWDSTNYDFSTKVERLPDTPEGREIMDEVNDIIDEREVQFMSMLSAQDCLEIRAALIRFGVPAAVLDAVRHE